MIRCRKISYHVLLTLSRFSSSIYYRTFAKAVGCGPENGNSSETTFQCLVSKDTETLQEASSDISSSGNYGTSAFLPDIQLLKKQVNGASILVGNNANEGPAFTIQNIATEDDFLSWLHATYPLFTIDDIVNPVHYYPSSNDSASSVDVEFATLGDSGPTALEVSQFGTGQQQRANNIYAESTVCPSYSLAEAFAGNNRTAYKLHNAQ